MVTASPQHVVQRLRELRAWADYIVDSLVRDQPYESGKIALLGQLTGEDSLREIRRLAWDLREKLDQAAVRLEYPPAEKP
ncbi:MAG TPA: hypothetical protein VE981_23935 [Planctomycetota bacterium]|nr:hypothetical protein [Planctomycetota bacterium]